MGTDDAHELFYLAKRTLSRFRPIVPDSVIDEIAQEAVLRLCAEPGVRVPRSFVRRVARNLALDHLRRTRRLLRLAQEPAVDPRARIEARLDLQRAWDRIQGAPPRTRAVFVALYAGDRDLDDLIDEETVARQAAGERATRSLVRDAWYKRRSRAERWLSQQQPS